MNHIWVQSDNGKFYSRPVLQTDRFLIQYPEFSCGPVIYVTPYRRRGIAGTLKYNWFKLIGPGYKYDHAICGVCWACSIRFIAPIPNDLIINSNGALDGMFLRTGTDILCWHWTFTPSDIKRIWDGERHWFFNGLTLASIRGIISHRLKKTGRTMKDLDYTSIRINR